MIADAIGSANTVTSIPSIVVKKINPIIANVDSPMIDTEINVNFSIVSPGSHGL